MQLLWRTSNNSSLLFWVKPISGLWCGEKWTWGCRRWEGWNNWRTGEGGCLLLQDGCSCCIQALHKRKPEDAASLLPQPRNREENTPMYWQCSDIQELSASQQEETGYARDGLLQACFVNLLSLLCIPRYNLYWMCVLLSLSYQIHRTQTFHVADSPISSAAASSWRVVF